MNGSNSAGAAVMAICPFCLTDRLRRKAYLRHKYDYRYSGYRAQFFEYSNSRRNDGHTLSWECDEVTNSVQPFARLYLRWNNGYLFEGPDCFSGWGATPRAAYREALRQQRLARHNVGDLLCKLGKAQRLINEMRAAALDVPIDQLEIV